MGTRHLITVKDESGVTKIAQYGQWDGYPSGQGVTILEFLADKLNKNAMSEALKNTRFISNDEHKALWVDAGAKPEQDFVSIDISNAFKSKNPQLDRDMGGEIISFVQDSGGTKLVDSSDFAEDGLFCEYHYIVDLQNNTFEVSGIKTYSLNSLPTKEQFLADTEGDQ